MGNTPSRSVLSAPGVHRYNCQHCNASLATKLYYCQSCKVARYCDTTCQSEDRSRHKLHCKDLKASRKRFKKRTKKKNKAEEIQPTVSELRAEIQVYNHSAPSSAAPSPHEQSNDNIEDPNDPEEQQPCCTCVAFIKKIFLFGMFYMFVVCCACCPRRVQKGTYKKCKRHRMKIWGGFFVVVSFLVPVMIARVQQPTAALHRLNLFRACEYGRLSTVKNLLKTAKGLDVNKHYSKFGNTALIAASEQGHSKIVQLLLTVKTIRVNEANQFGETALYMAAQEGYLRVVKLLIKVKGIRVNLQCSLEDATPHGMDCATPLYIASARGHHQVVKVLLTKKGINVNRGTRNADSLIQGVSPLLVAIQHRHIKGTLKIIQLLLSSSSIDVNQPDPDMFTPLYIACQDGHVNLVDNGATPLFTACFNGRLDVVRLLLARKDIHCNHPTKNGATPLLIASQEGHFEIVDALLQMNGIRVGRSDIYGNTPIDVARQHGHQKIVDVLIAAS